MVEIKGEGKKWSLPTTYKGINMRSKMEARTAYILDQLELDWKYEPKSFMLKNGMSYIPDFYIPELDTWVEVKGVMEEKDKKQIEQFNEEEHEILLLMEDKAYFYEATRFDNDDEDDTAYMVGEKQEIQLGHCSRCDSYFFCGTLGSFHCRQCGFHNGDHDFHGLPGLHNDSPTGGIKKLELYIQRRKNDERRR